jgi:DNA replication protein DnaC
MVAAAMLDRLMHRSAVRHIHGESYGMRAHQRRTHNLRDAAKPTKRD